MTALLLTGGFVVVAAVAVITALRLLVAEAHNKARAEVKAQQAEKDNAILQKYTDIATQPHDVERTGRLLDDGKF